jgi:hypothetical protein
MTQFNFKQKLFLLIFILSLFICIKRNIKIEPPKNSFEIVCDINKERVIAKKYKLKNKEIQKKDSKKLILEMINSEDCLICSLIITNDKVHQDIFQSRKNFSFKKFPLSKASEKKKSRSDTDLDSQDLEDSKKNDRISHKGDKTKRSNSFEKSMPCHKEKKGISCEKSSSPLKNDFCVFLITNDKVHYDIFQSQKNFSFKKFPLSKVFEKKESRSDTELDSQDLEDSKKNYRISHKSNKTKRSNSFKKSISCHKKKKGIDCKKSSSPLKDSFYLCLVKDHSKIFLDLRLPHFNDNICTNSDLNFRYVFKDHEEPILEEKNLNEEELISENYSKDNDSRTPINEIYDDNSQSSQKEFSFEESQLPEVSKEKELGSKAKIDSLPTKDNSIKNNHELHKSNEKTKKSNAFSRLMVSHKEGNGIGYEEGYTSLRGSFYAYLVKDHTNMFFDVRLHYFNDGTYAANSGIGFRHALENSNNTLGFNVYYDSRKIRGSALFNQIGIGLEYLGIVDCRLNGYIPIQRRKKFKGSTEKDYEDGYKMIKNKYKRALGSISFELGHYLVDYKNFKMYGAVGQYYLETGNCTMAFGGNSRLNFEIGKYVSIEFAGTYDTLFKARANGIIKLHFTWGRSKKKNRDLLKQTNRRDIIPLKNTYKYSWNW